jgi:hypothetical protein
VQEERKNNKSIEYGVKTNSRKDTNVVGLNILG